MLFLYLYFKVLIINYFVWRCGNINDSIDNDNEVTIIRDENGNIVSIITANQDVIGYQNTLKVELISDESSQDGTVIDISLIDPSGSFVQPQGDVELCFNPKDGNEDDQCLGFLNEETNEWECEDKCLKQDDNGLLCGDDSVIDEDEVTDAVLDGVSVLVPEGLLDIESDIDEDLLGVLEGDGLLDAVELAVEDFEIDEVADWELDEVLELVEDGVVLLEVLGCAVGDALIEILELLEEDLVDEIDVVRDVVELLVAVGDLDGVILGVGEHTLSTWTSLNPKDHTKSGGLHPDPGV